MTTLPPLPLIDGCLFIDNSRWIEPLSNCHRSHEYGTLRARVRNEQKSALTFGSAEHLCLEYRSVKCGNQRVDPWIDDEVATLLHAFYEENPVPEGDWRTLNWAVEVFRRYNQKYPTEEFSLLKYEKPVPCPYCHGQGEVPDEEQPTVDCVWCNGTGERTAMVEMPFVLHLYDHIPSMRGNDVVCIPVLYTGKIDLPLSLDGSIWIMDNKTSKDLGPFFWTRMKMSSQMRGYCWAFEELTGQPVKGYMVNGIRTKEPPQYVNNGTTFRNKAQSPEQWWAESFHRERYYLQSGWKDQWKQNTIARMEEFFWHYSRGYMPMNTESCTKYGACPYIDVCEMESDERLNFLESPTLYTNNEWSPLTKVAEKGEAC